ncbi:MAG TPA: CRISPR-associated endonuclease Cas2 [Candidatus Paceibacterota bacterium]
MKSDFIPKFIKAIIETGKDFHEVWQWQALYYKGFQVSGFDYKKTEKCFRNLQHREIICKTSGDYYKFTTKGRKWFSNSVLRHPRLRYDKWDKKWRVVIFDIPEELHKNRNQLRAKLKNLGFYMLQKSVFVIPYPCEKELGYVCKNLKIADYVDVILAESVGFKEKEIKKFFNL